MNNYDYFYDHNLENRSLYRVIQGKFHKYNDEYIEVYIGENKWKNYIQLFEYHFDPENDDQMHPISVEDAIMLKQAIDERPLKVRIDKEKEIITDRNVLIESIDVGMCKNYGSRIQDWYSNLLKHNIAFKKYVKSMDKESKKELNNLIAYPNFDNRKDLINVLKKYNSPFLAGKLKIIKHLPHVSLDMPVYEKGIYPNKDSRYHLMDSFEFNKYNYKMSDVGVDRLFKDIDGDEVIPKYSRLYCDVEKYLDDKKEIMSRLGMGVIYKRLYDGKPLSLFYDSERENIIKYYKEYHNNFKEKVNKYLDEGYNVLILDLHSFSEEQAEAFSEGSYPDICIGINKEYKDDSVTNYIVQQIKKRKYSYKIDFPYSGSFVPNRIDKNKAKGKLVSIMIEVNKKLYL